MAGVKGRSGRVKGIPNGLSAYERVLLRIEEKPNECWIWLGAIDKKSGYGKIKDGKTMNYVHRVVYTAVVGPIPIGYEVDHECRVRECCNPAHLEAVTKEENIFRSECWAAINARKTGCPKAHGNYDAIYANGHRYCKQCKCEKESRRRARKKPD